MFAAFAVSFCACYLICYMWQLYRKAFEDAPKTVPLWQCIKIIIFQDGDLWTKIKLILRLVEERGGVACGYFYDRGFRGVYAISDPEDGMTALKACGEKDFLYDYVEPWLGRALFTGSRQVNKVQRKLITKSLMPTNLEAFMKFFNMHSERMINKLSSRIDGGPFDIIHDLKRFNFELLCDTLLAFDDLESINVNQYLDAVSKYLKMTLFRFETVYLQHDFFFTRTVLKQKQLALLHCLHETRDQIISHRRKKLKDIEEHKCDPVGHEVLLDHFLEAAAKGIATEKEILFNVDGLLFAGHDTSAYTLLYTLVLLGSHPEVQERAYEEIQQILGERDVTRQESSKLVYLDAIINESTRIYPYGAVVLRRASEDIKLKSCTMKAGCTVLVSTWSVHRHKSWGPDVEVFRPERWLKPEKLPKPTILLGFSEGPRNCIGKRYAMLSMKVLLAHLIRRYKFKADHTKLQFEFMGVLEAISGHHIAIETRR